MREKARRGKRTFALTADVSEAHRHVPVARRDWKLPGCRVRPGSFVFANTVGTFGISSFSYYWSRIGSGIGRLVQHVCGTSATTWIMSVRRSIAPCRFGRFLRRVRFARCSSIMEKDVRRVTPSHGWGIDLFHESYKLDIPQRRA